MIYIPDIDKWERWDISIEDILVDADIAYLDGLFSLTENCPDVTCQRYRILL
ncbi:MAG: hypothetical protein P8J37_24275 [Fuerstiella sp.]|nr:hypothetical protein [Fuerstiella sp.]